MKKNNKLKSILVIAVLIAAIVACAYITFIGIGPTGQGAAKNINLGLDLAGGVSITYQTIDDDVSSEDMADTVDKLQLRAESYNSEAEVYQEGTNRINVEIPDISNAETILEEMGSPGSLQFIYSNSETNSTDVVLTGTDVEDAYARTQQNTQTGAIEHVVVLSLTDDAAERFGEVTTKAIGTQIAIIYDDEVISSPYVNEPITDGQPCITGLSSYSEADELAKYIRIGGLSVELEEVRSNIVSAKLGDKAIDKSVQSGIIGLLIIIILMCVVYLVPGAVSSISLVLYALLMMVIINAYNFTFTIAGIAGIILSIGMAVDANVIIFARIKEEIAAGNAVRASIRTGYKKAFSAIIDGNVTTLIAAAILMIFGYGSIKSFAQTLAIGIILSMVVALVITRLIINALYALGVNDAKFFGRAKEHKAIDFVGKRYAIMIISIGLIIVGVGFFVTNQISGNHGFNYSIEFLGGTSTTVTFPEEMSIEKVENEVVPYVEEITGDGNIQTQVVKSEGNKQVIIKTRDLNEDERASLKNVLVENFSIDAKSYDSSTIDSTISGEMRNQAIKAVILAVVCMLIYIGFRFKDFKLGISAIICLVHDVLIVLTAYAVFRIPVGNTFIACLLTIVGYCINSTIVIFDRMRENLSDKKISGNLADVINTSITQSITRSVYTFLSTFIMVAVIYVNGVTAIREFAGPLMVGLVAGLFSSNFHAGSIWYMLKGGKKDTK